MHETKVAFAKGRVVFWSSTEWSSLTTIQDGLAKVARPNGRTLEDFAPKARTSYACLRDAISVQFPKQRVEKLETNKGFACLQIHRHRDDVTTSTMFAVEADEQNMDFSFLRGYRFDWEDQLKAEFQRQRGLLKPSQVTGCLVGILSNCCNYVPLRPTGGVYWIPEESFPLWASVVPVIESAGVGGTNSVYQITHDLDADVVRAVRDSFQKLIEVETQEITRLIEEGGLGERALKTQAERAESLQAKIKEYERILSEQLPATMELAKQAEVAALFARVQASTAA